MRTLQVWVLVLLLLLPVSLAAEDVIVDLDNLYISKPKIVLDFTAPSQLHMFDLRSADGARIYQLCEQPTVTSETFATSYELLATSATDAACTNGEPEYLVPGDYLLLIQASDINKNPTKLYRVPFNTSGLEITLLSPLSNVSLTRPMAITFETTRVAPTIIGQESYREPVDSQCRYTLDSLTPSRWAQLKYADLRSAVNDGVARSEHVLQITDPSTVYIICKESVAAGQEAKFAVDISYDETPPRISGITKTPAKVTSLRGDTGLMTLKLTTDDRSVCDITGEHNTKRFMEEDLEVYGTYTSSHDVILEFPLSAIGAAAKNFTYEVRCTNLAGRHATALVNVSVDFSNALTLAILEPAGIINRTSFDIVARPAPVADPAKEISGCYLDDTGSKLAANAMTRGTYPDGSGGTMTVYRKAVSYAADGSQDGDKTYTITCYDQQSTTRTHTITLDSRPPSPPMINASPFICDGNITAKFKSADKGTGVISYTYAVSDSGGIIAAGTTSKDAASIKISRPVQGPITWSVAASDGAQNNGSANTTTVMVGEGMDEECGRPPFITLKEPNRGMATSAPYDLIIGTARPAACSFSFLQTERWSDMTPMESADGRTHVSGDFHRRFSQSTPKTVYVGCNDTARLYLKSFRIGMDVSAPKISVSGTPNPVVDRSRRVVTLAVKTDEPTYCTIDGDEETFDNHAFGEGSDEEQSSYKTEHQKALSYRHVDDLSYQEFPYTITCKNLALMESTAEHNTIVHLGAGFTIEILSPPQFTNKDDITIAIRPSREATCTWDDNGTTKMFVESNGTHAAHLGIMEEKGYSIPVLCTSFNLEASEVIEFVIDKSVPVIEGLQGPEVLCQNMQGEFTLNITNTLESDPLITYTIASNGTNDTFTTDDDVIVLDGATMETGNYTLSVIVTNRANTSSVPASTQFEVARRRSEACTLPADHCTNGQMDAGERNVDCGGTCPACTSCGDDDACGPGEWCSEGVCIPSVLECDSDGMCDPGQTCEEGKCVTQNDMCANDDECAETEECISGTCTRKPECVIDNDCFGGICRSGVCEDTPTAGCVSDDDCASGEVCRYDSCTSTDGSPGDGLDDGPEESDESNLLSILLIAVGIAIMGGAGYVLYQQQSEKSIAASVLIARPPARTQLSPPMAAEYAQDPAARQAALEQEYARRQVERAKRESTFEAFKDAPEPSQPPSAQPPKRPPAEPGDEYVDLSAVKRKTEQKQQEKPTRKEDAFDDLEKL